MTGISSKRVLLISTAIGFAWPLAMPTIADAQTVAADDAQAVAENRAPGDIVVTARRTEERLQDVPISITVLSQQAIANRNITQLSDLASYTPGLAVNQRFGPERATFSIRGFSQDPGTSPTVGAYLAEVPGIRVQGGGLAGNSLGPGSFMDLQNVQVLKGPQGTLFGRNTTGGAVLLVPNRPTDRLEGWIEGQGGNYNMRRFQGVLNLPISDTFKARIAFDDNKRDGYLKNKFNDGLSPKNFDDVNYTSLRATLLAELTPNLENTTIFQYGQLDQHGYAQKMVACTLPTYTPTPPGFTPAGSTVNFTGLQGAAACDQIARQNARGDGLLDVETRVPGGFISTRQWQAINTTIFKATDNLTLKNIFSYGGYREQSRIPSFNDNLLISPSTPLFRAAQTNPANIISVATFIPFSSNISSFIPGVDNVNKRAWTEEFQVQAKFENFNGVAGIYTERNREPNLSPRRNFVSLSCSNYDTPTCTDPLGIGSISESRQIYNYDTTGIFAEGTFDVSSKLSLTLGARYTWDKTSALAANSRIRFVGTPSQARFCTDSLRFNPNTAITDFNQCQVPFTAKSSAPTWNIVLQYKPIEDLMLYAKQGRGYRQGGINVTAVGRESWNPEKVDAYEAGAKFSFDGSVRGYFNIAGFYDKINDTQITATTVPTATSGIPQGSAVINAAVGKVKGVEVDASAELFRGLRLDVGYIYLNTKITGVPISIPVTGGVIQTLLPRVVDGAGLVFSPKNRVTATLTYTAPLPADRGNLSFGVTFTHTDSQVDNATAKFGILPATNLTNLNLNWQGVLGSRFDVGAFVTNLTNEIYASATTTTPGAYDVIAIGLPRMFGARLRYNFGN